MSLIGGLMTTKGEETKKIIRDTAYKVFALKGFKEVTMKDICEITGLSRGGLYRHYGSTGQIFQDILSTLLVGQNHDFMEKIENQVSAINILDKILYTYENEMLDDKNSLSLAIYEYFSSQEGTDNDFLSKQYLASYSLWKTLITYGISRQEFKVVDVKSVFDVIVFSYQGVRMYSRLMPMDPKIPAGIIKQIKQMLIKGEA